MITQSPKCSDGFTLIELLVTISLIGILAAIALQRYSDYNRRAADAVAISVAHSARTAIYAGQENPTWTLTADIRISSSGVVTELNGTLADVAPGFTPQPNVGVALQSTPSTSWAYVAASHCRGTQAGTGYEAYTTEFGYQTSRSTIEPQPNEYFSYPIDGSGC